MHNLRLLKFPKRLSWKKRIDIFAAIKIGFYEEQVR
jgi:hypothetical protein